MLIAVTAQQPLCPDLAVILYSGEKEENDCRARTEIVFFVCVLMRFRPSPISICIVERCRLLIVLAVRTCVM